MLEKKGKIEAFSLGREDVGERLEIPQKLYGRDRELEMLLNAWERIANPNHSRERPQKEMLLLKGDAGVGKSAAGGGNFIRGKCVSDLQIYSVLLRALDRI